MEDFVTWENFENQKRFSDVGNEQYLTSWLHDDDVKMESLIEYVYIRLTY